MHYSTKYLIASNVFTKYDSNAVIDNVIVEPNGRNGVNILVQGNNIAHSNVTFKAPTSIEQLEDNVTSSFSSVLAMFTDNQPSGKTVQILTLLIFAGILLAEIRFIKSKYDELQSEKIAMVRDIENTQDFKEHMPGYGNAGIKKPYTTPVYGVASNTSNIRANYLKRMNTTETTTLNMLINNDNKESEIIDRLVNNKPVFGSLSNREVRTDVLSQVSETAPVSNPLNKDRFNKQLEHLEAMTKLYKKESKQQKSVDEIKARLNELY